MTNLTPGEPFEAYGLMWALALSLLLLACTPDAPCEWGGDECPAGSCVRWSNTDRRCEAPCDEGCSTCCSYVERDAEAYCVPWERQGQWCKE